MAEVVGDFTLRIDAGVAGAQKELDEFVAARKVEAEAMFTSGQELRTWAAQAAVTKRSQNEAEKDSRRDLDQAKRAARHQK